MPSSLSKKEDVAMLEYTIVRKEKELNWETVPALEISTALWTDRRIDISSYAQFCYDDEAIYVHLWTREKHIRAEETGAAGMPFEDSCLEFFFSPVPGNPKYFNIEFNPLCCVYLGLGTGLKDQVRLVPLNDPLQPHAERTADGWGIYYHIPFSFIRFFFPEFQVRSGMEIRANCFKCGNRTLEPHYFSWNPVTVAEKNFHIHEDFGLMRFA